MAGRGPAATPTAILKTRGSWRARIRPDEPKPEPGTPTCPAWMPDEGKAEWSRIVGQLRGLGLLTKLDRASLAVYCQAWADFVKAATESDSFAIRDMAAKRVVQTAAQFGMSPAARARVQAVKDTPKDAKGKYFQTG